MSGRGRPQATFADPYLAAAKENTDDWCVFVVDDPDEALRVARKIRRDNSGDVRTLMLSTDRAVLAIRASNGSG